MKYKIILFLVVSFFVQEVKSQVFKSDWSDFTSVKYIVEFAENKTTYASLNNIGELHFKSRIDSSKFIIYYVFNTEEITDAFENADLVEQIQSCVRDTDVAYFRYQNYYYLMTPWQNCENTNDLLFTDLPQEIINFISVKRSRK